MALSANGSSAGGICKVQGIDSRHMPGADGAALSLRLGRRQEGAGRRRSSRVGVTAAGEESNGAASSSKYTGRYQSSITLKTLLEKSKHLGGEQHIAGTAAETGEEGQGLRTLTRLNIGDKPECSCCKAMGSVACATCAASGKYTDPIMESQGIIVKVRCLGCGGSGTILCSACHGRGYQAS